MWNLRSLCGSHITAHLLTRDICTAIINRLSHSLLGKKPRTKAPRIQRLVTPRVLQHKRRRIALKRQRTQKNKEEASEYAKLLAKRMKVCRFSYGTAYLLLLYP